MGFLSNISIKRKLVLMQLFTAIIVVILCSSVYFYFDYKTLKDQKEKSLKSMAHVMANNFVAPMLFLDKSTAEEVIQDFRVKEDVLNAEVIDSEHNSFVKFNKSEGKDYQFKKQNTEPSTLKYDGNKIIINEPIISENERIGTLLISADFSDVQEQINERLWLMAMIILIGGILSFIISIIIQKYISKPINDLAEVMSDIIEGKNFSLRSELKSKDEIGTMSDAFNSLLEEVESYSKTLEDSNRILEHKVELRTQELKENNEKLVVARQKEEESSKAKEQFMTSISHEIRTPLNAIVGFQELLRDTVLTEEQLEYLNAIDFAGKNLLVLINDVLDISKIESGKFVFVDSDIELRRVLKAIMDLMEFKAKENHILLKSVIDERIPPFVIGDQSRLTQVLINLLGNAVKFTEKGFVEMKVSLLNENDEKVKLQFRIEDTGIGIPEEKVKDIFDRFTQVSADTNVKYGGTGLGLSIVKEIVDLQGGRVYVESQFGVGSIFYVELEFKKSKNLSRAIPNKEQLSDRFGVKGKKLHGLLAEDVVMNQRLVHKILEKHGHTIDIVSNGIHALDKIAENDYDFVLMDVLMPDMGGHEASMKIRALEDPKKRSLPILGLTAHATTAERDKCIQSGMNDVVFKPFNAHDLVLKIYSLVYDEVQTIENSPTEKIELKDFDLNELKTKAGDDTNFLLDMLSEFSSVMPQKLEEIKASANSNNATELDFSIHKLKSILPVFGMQTCLALLDELSELLKTTSDSPRKTEIVDMLIEKFTNALEIVKLELTQLTKVN